MKAISYSLLLLAAAFFICRCTSTESQVNQHWSAYKTAMQHGDVTSAIAEVNSVYSLDTSSQYALDTLMRLYFLRGNHISAYAVGSKIRDKQSIHKSILAESALQLGQAEEAKALMIDVETNDTAGLNIGTMYKLATLYFNDEEYAEALEVLGKIVDDERSMKQTTRISGDNTVAQIVPLYAASHNFAGFVFLVLNEFDTAESHFNEALRVQPDFKLAKNNVVQLNQQRAEATAQ